MRCELDRAAHAPVKLRLGDLGGGVGATRRRLRPHQMCERRCDRAEVVEIVRRQSVDERVEPGGNGCRLVARKDPRGLAHHLRDRPVRDALSVRQTATGHDGRTLRSCSSPPPPRRACSSRPLPRRRRGRSPRRGELRCAPRARSAARAPRPVRPAARSLQCGASRRCAARSRRAPAPPCPSPERAPPLRTRPLPRRPRRVRSSTRTPSTGALDWRRAAVLSTSPHAMPRPSCTRASSATIASPVVTPTRTLSSRDGSSSFSAWMASITASPARTARSGSSSCATGAPNSATTASPMNFSTVPP